MGTFEPPEHLVNAIINGRCIAFVGAGFSAVAMPTWTELLRALATKLRVDLPDLSTKATALDFEAAGQHLRDEAKGRWEALVRKVLKEHVKAEDPAKRHRLQTRREHLLQIPFKAT